MCVLLLRVLLRATRGEWLCGASDCRLPDVAPTGCAVLHVATSAGHACLPRRAQLWHFAQDGERAAEPAPSADVSVPVCACVRLLVALGRWRVFACAAACAGRVPGVVCPWPTRGHGVALHCSAAPPLVTHLVMFFTRTSDHLQDPSGPRLYSTHGMSVSSSKLPFTFKSRQSLWLRHTDSPVCALFLFALLADQSPCIHRRCVRFWGLRCSTASRCCKVQAQVFKLQVRHGGHEGGRCDKLRFCVVPGTRVLEYRGTR